MVGALALAAVATAAALWGWLRPGPRRRCTATACCSGPTEGLRPSAIAGNIAISPDGNRIAYIGPAEGGTRLWLREHDKLRPLPIAGTEDGVSPFFSPDGSQLAFIVGGRSLRVAPLDGGPPVTLSDSLNCVRRRLGNRRLHLHRAAGRARAASGRRAGPIEVLFRLSDERHEIGAEYPNVMPDGKGLVFRRRLAGQPANEFEIMEMAVPAGVPHPLVRGVYARYASSGHLLVVTSDGKLLAMPFDPRKRALTGAPVAVMDGLLRSGPFEVNFAVIRHRDAGVLRPAAAPPRTTPGGSTATAPEPRRWTRPGIRRGTSARLPSRRTAKSLAVTLLRGASQDIWVKQLPTGPFSRVTFGDTVHFRPAWTADGRSLVYINDLGSGRRPADDDASRRHRGAPRAVELVASSSRRRSQTGDGHWLVLRRSFAEAGNGDLYAVKTGDTTLVPLLTTPRAGDEPRRLARRSLAGLRLGRVRGERGLRPAVPGRGVGRWQVSVSGGTLPVWARSGRELFYLNGHGEMTSLALEPGPGFAVGQPRVLFPAGPFVMAGNAGVYDVSPDGRRFRDGAAGRRARASRSWWWCRTGSRSSRLGWERTSPRTMIRSARLIAAVWLAVSRKSGAWRCRDAGALSDVGHVGRPDG